jgi:co-chaperonin GroES (HSP10)
MIVPRNTLVILELILKQERKVGAITVLANNELYAEAEVVAVGPGTKSAEGGVSETFDLKVGQRVWVRAKNKVRTQLGEGTDIAGIEYRDGDKVYHIFEQGSILGIIAEPDDRKPVVQNPLHQL